MELTQQQANDLQTSSLGLMQTAINTVGVDATVQMLTFLDGLIKDKPDVAKKLADPKNQKALADMAAKYKNKKPSPLELPGMFAQLTQIFG